MGEKFSLYLQGNWSKLSQLLLNEIKYVAMTGDFVQLCIKLSQYGCCQLHLGNQSEAYIIYQFFKNDINLKPSLSEKERASITRFLALYYLFEGNLKEALFYYEQSIASYCLQSEEKEEVMMLLESDRWLYCLLGDQEKRSYIENRIGPTYKDHLFVDLISDPTSFWNYILFYSQREENSHPLIHQFVELHKSMKANHPKVKTDKVYLLLAKAEQYKHPILKVWANYFAGLIVQKKEYIEKSMRLFQEYNIRLEPLQDMEPIKKISFSLFNQLAVKKEDNLLYSLNNWKRKKAEELLIYMLIQPSLQVHKDVLLEDLFQEEDSKKATKRLYVNISAVNQVIREISNIDASIIFMKEGKVCLNLDVIDEIDVQIYLKLYSVGKQLWFTNREDAVELFNKARQIFSHHIVDQLLYISWLDQYRITLIEKHYDLLQRLYSYYEDSNTKEMLLQEMLDCDPLNEETIEEKICFLQSQGRYFEAEQFYKQKRKLIQSELGIDFELDVLK